MQRFRKIYIEITNVCNLKCSFCPESKRESRFMNSTEFEDILEKIKGYTNLLTFHVKGEPLMHQDLKLFLLLADKHGFKVDLTTNGTLLDCLDEEILFINSLRQINISLHSFKDQRVGLKLIEKFLLNRRKEDLYISIRDWSSEQLEYFKGKEHYKNVFLNKGSSFKWPNIEDPVIGNVGTCYGGRSHVAILVDGSVVPCCLDNDGIIKLGNIFTNDLERILNSDRYNDLTKGFNSKKLVEDLCQRCTYCRRFSK